MVCSAYIDLHKYHRSWRNNKLWNYDPFVNAFLIIGIDLVKVISATDYGERSRLELYVKGQLKGVINEPDFPICTVVEGVSHDGRGYNWISDGDGSLNRLRESIIWQ